MEEQETVPFEVTEELDIGDLSAVSKPILPAAQGVKVQIQGARLKTSKSGELKSFLVTLKLIEGINVGGETKYVNKLEYTSFMDLLAWGSDNVKSESWFQEAFYAFKQFLIAIEEPISPAPKINDAWIESIKGRECLVNVVHSPNSTKNEAGKSIKDGTFSVSFKNWKKVS